MSSRAFRNRTNTVGLAASNYGFGDIGGSVNYNTTTDLYAEVVASAEVGVHFVVDGGCERNVAQIELAAVHLHVEAYGLEAVAGDEEIGGAVFESFEAKVAVKAADSGF